MTKQPKTGLDTTFLAVVDAAMAQRRIRSDRAMSVALGRFPDFINRVRNGYQSAPPEAWDALLLLAPNASPAALLLENEQLRSQLADKLKIIALQDEQIALLRAQMSPEINRQLMAQ